SGSVRDTDAAPLAPAGAGLARSTGFAAAVDDVRPPEVPQWIAPGVHESAEWPQPPYQPCRGGVDLVDHRSVRDGLGVRRETEQPAKPRRDRRAVVVAMSEQVDADGRSDAGQNDDQQQDQRDVVDGRGGRPYPRYEKASACEDYDTANHENGGEGTGGGGEPAIRAFLDGRRPPPTVPDQDFHDVAGGNGGTGAM